MQPIGARSKAKSISPGITKQWMDVQEFRKVHAVPDDKHMEEFRKVKMHMDQWSATVEKYRNRPMLESDWYTLQAEHYMKRPRITQEFAHPDFACLTMQTPEKDDAVAVHLGLDKMHREVDKEIARLSSAADTPVWS